MKRCKTGSSVQGYTTQNFDCGLFIPNEAARSFLLKETTEEKLMIFLKTSF